MHDLGPVEARAFTAMLVESGEKRQVAYAALLDRYHELYAMENDLRRSMASQGEIEPVNRDRDLLHKQLERLGASIGKSKDTVLCDVLGREGNLGEYHLPEYALVTPDQADGSDRFGVGAFNADPRRYASFTSDVAQTSATDLLQQQKQRQESGFSTESREEFESNRPEAGSRKSVDTLVPGEVAVIFGTTYTQGTKNNDRISIEPPGYPERFRRAVAALDALQKQGVSALLFERQVGAYHVTASFFGVVVPAQSIDPTVVGLLRSNRSLFGIRPEDMDADIVPRDYQEHLRTGYREPIIEIYFDLRSLLYKTADGLSDGESAALEDRYNGMRTESPELAQLYESDGVEYVIRVFQRVFMTANAQVVQMVRDELTRSVNERETKTREEFLAMHKEFFGTQPL